jgi:hypothetical protein
MADTLRDNPFDASDLPAGLQAVVADLNAKLNAEDAGWTEHHKDVFRAIRQCIIDRKPIDKELQEQYVNALANSQAVNKYGL